MGSGDFQSLDEGLQIGIEALQVACTACLQAPPPLRKRCEVAHDPALHGEIFVAPLFLHLQRESACMHARPDEL